MDAAAPPVRWGIIGCARIAQKNVNSIRRARNATLVAVASRSKERCSKWCRTYLTDQEFDSVQAYGSYEELLADRNVDAVYLPLPTSLHKQWAAKVIAARKHLLIEKPAALSMEDLREITDGCRRNGLVFMDGVMFHHHRRMQRIVRHINDPVFGKVSRITSGFSFPSDDSFRKSDIRTSADGDPLGCVGDLGWYNIRFSLLVTGRTPDAVRCHFNNVVNGTVPFDTDTTLYWFKKGALTDNNSARNIIAGGGGDMVVEHVSTFHSSFNEPMRQWVEVTATPRIPGAAPKCLTLRDFVLPRNAERVNFKEQAAVGFADFVTLMTDAETTYETQGCCQEADMFEAFCALVDGLKRGRGSQAAPSLSRRQTLERCAYWRRTCLETQAVTDACMASGRAGGALVQVAPVHKEDDCLPASRL